jgi:hypothetical protein
MSDSEIKALDGVVKTAGPYTENGYKVTNYEASEMVSLGEQEYLSSANLTTVNGKLAAIRVYVELRNYMAESYYWAVASKTRDLLLQRYSGWKVELDRLDLSRPESKIQSFPGNLMKLTDSTQNRVDLLFDADQETPMLQVVIFSAEGFKYLQGATGHIDYDAQDDERVDL